MFRAMEHDSANGLKLDRGTIGEENNGVKLGCEAIDEGNGRVQLGRDAIDEENNGVRLGRDTVGDGNNGVQLDRDAIGAGKFGEQLGRYRVSKVAWAAPARAWSREASRKSSKPARNRRSEADPCAREKRPRGWGHGRSGTRVPEPSFWE